MKVFSFAIGVAWEGTVIGNVEDCAGFVFKSSHATMSEHLPSWNLW